MRRVVRQIIAVGVVLAILPIGSAFASDPVILQGRVAAPGDAADTGFGGVTVTLYDSSRYPVAYKTAASNGTYSFTQSEVWDFTAGNYYVSVYGGEFGLPYWYSGNTPNEEAATPVTLSGTSPVTHNITVTGIRGTVTSSAAGAQERSASAYDALSGDEYWDVAWANTTSDGRYFLAVPAGSYKVKFSVWRSDPYGSSNIWSGNAARFDGAETIPVSASSTPVRNQAFTTISGTLTIPAGFSTEYAGVRAGRPVQHTEEDDGDTYTWWEDQMVASASLGTGGAYQLIVPAGQYAVSFIADDYWTWTQYYHPGTSKVQEATLVTAPATGVNGVFRTISGKVVDDSNVAVADASVQALEAGQDDWWSDLYTRTASDGTYKLLTWPGTFHIVADHTKYGSCDEWMEECLGYSRYRTYHGGSRTASPVNTTSADQTNKNLTFRVIRGRVTESAGGTGLAGASVSATEFDDDNWDGEYGYATTDANGYYELGVPSGSYRVSFSDYTSDWYQYYDQVRSYSLATPVAVTNTTSASNIHGIKGVYTDGPTTISGKVTFPSGMTPSGKVYAWGYDNNGYASATIASDGTYSMNLSESGEYEVEVNASNSDYTTEGYAIRNVVANGATGGTLNVTFAKITGTVTKPSGVYSSVSVRKSTNWWSDGGWGKVAENGTYTALAPATTTNDYHARFHGSTWNEDDEWSWGYGSGNGYSGGAHRASAATKFAAPATNINHRFNLISGTVTDSAGNAVGADVTLVNGDPGAPATHSWDNWDEERGYAYTMRDGTYQIPVSASNQLKARFDTYNDNSYTSLETQWYNAKTSYTADVISVGATADRTGIDARFARGGISGKVTATDNTTGVPNVCVSAWSGATQVGSATTRSDGTYTLYTAAGSYTLKFIHCVAQPVYKDQWFNGATQQSSATAVTVVDKTITSGRNVTLQTGFVTTPPVATTTTGGSSATTTVDPRTGESTTTMPTGEKTSVTYSYVPTCASGTPTGPYTLHHNGKSWTMTGPVNGAYSHTISSVDVSTGPVTVKFKCGTTDVERTLGTIQLYDPSGDVTNANTGAAVMDATVTLYRVPGWEPKTSSTDTRANTCQSHYSKSATTPWNQAVTADNLKKAEMADPLSGMISPALNPQKTNGKGRYGWDVAMGCWFVTVSKAGYHDYTSPLV